MIEESNIWNKKFLELAGVYRDELCKSNPEEFLKLLANSPIRISILCESYGVMVKLKMIEPIENLPQDEKEKHWLETKRLSDSDDKAHLIKAAKAMYALGQFLQL